MAKSSLSNLHQIELRSSDTFHATLIDSPLRLRGGNDHDVVLEKAHGCPFKTINVRRGNAMRWMVLSHIKEKPIRSKKALIPILFRERRKAMECIAAEALYCKQDAYPPEERFYPLFVKPVGDIYYIPEKRLNQMVFVSNKLKRPSKESVASHVTWETSSEEEDDYIVDLKTEKLHENAFRCDQVLEDIEHFCFQGDDGGPFSPRLPLSPIASDTPWRSLYESASDTTAHAKYDTGYYEYNIVLTRSLPTLKRKKEKREKTEQEIDDEIDAQFAEERREKDKEKTIAREWKNYKGARADEPTACILPLCECDIKKMVKVAHRARKRGLGEEGDDEDDGAEYVEGDTSSSEDDEAARKKQMGTYSMAERGHTERKVERTECLIAACECDKPKVVKAKKAKQPGDFDKSTVYAEGGVIMSDSDEGESSDTIPPPEKGQTYTTEEIMEMKKKKAAARAAAERENLEKQATRDAEKAAAADLEPKMHKQQPQGRPEPGKTIFDDISDYEEGSYEDSEEGKEYEKKLAEGIAAEPPKKKIKKVYKPLPELEIKHIGSDVDITQRAAGTQEGAFSVAEMEEFKRKKEQTKKEAMEKAADEAAAAAAEKLGLPPPKKKAPRPPPAPGEIRPDVKESTSSIEFEMPSKPEGQVYNAAEMEEFKRKKEEAKAAVKAARERAAQAAEERAKAERPIRKKIGPPPPGIEEKDWVEPVPSDDFIPPPKKVEEKAQFSPEELEALKKQKEARKAQYLAEQKANAEKAAALQKAQAVPASSKPAPIKTGAPPKKPPAVYEQPRPSDEAIIALPPRKSGADGYTAAELKAHRAKAKDVAAKIQIARDAAAKAAAEQLGVPVPKKKKKLNKTDSTSNEMIDIKAPDGATPEQIEEVKKKQKAADLAIKKARQVAEASARKELGVGPKPKKKPFKPTVPPPPPVKKASIKPEVIKPVPPVKKASIKPEEPKPTPPPVKKPSIKPEEPAVKKPSIKPETAAIPVPIPVLEPPKEEPPTEPGEGPIEPIKPTPPVEPALPPPPPPPEVPTTEDTPVPPVEISVPPPPPPPEIPVSPDAAPIEAPTPPRASAPAVPFTPTLPQPIDTEAQPPPPPPPEVPESPDAVPPVAEAPKPVIPPSETQAQSLWGYFRPNVERVGIESAGPSNRPENMEIATGSKESVLSKKDSQGGGGLLNFLTGFNLLGKKKSSASNSSSYGSVSVSSKTSVRSIASLFKRNKKKRHP